MSVRAIYDYQAQRADELNFGRGAVITNVEKHDGGWWCGDYGKLMRGWFPANHVEEIADDDNEGGSHLGEVEEGSLPIIGCSMEIIQLASSNLYVLRITSRNHTAGLEVGASTVEEAQQWKEAIEAANKKANSAVRRNRLSVVIIIVVVDYRDRLLTNNRKHKE